MLLLSNQDVVKSLSMAECLEAMENSFRDLALGEGINRPRADSYIPQAPETFYLFRSLDGALPRYGVYAAGVNSGLIREPMVDGKRRQERFTDCYTGLLMLFDLENGKLLCMMQDEYLQRTITAATTGLATKYLARPESAIAGLIGTGRQAGAQVQALKAVLPSLREIRIYGPNPTHRENFAAEWSSVLNLKVTPVSSAQEAVIDADVLCLATNSLTPVLDGNWLKPGTHLNSVQGNELDARSKSRADVIAICSREEPGVRILGGQLPLEYSERTHFTTEDVYRVKQLGSIIAGRSRGRFSPDQITLFGGSGIGWSAGLGTQFAAAGAAAYRRAMEAGLGRQLQDNWFV